MKKLLLLFTFINAIAFSQIPETSDSIYYSSKYCNSVEELEDCYEAWTWGPTMGDGTGDCYQAGYYGPGMCDAVWPALWVVDTYECCCKVASTPGMEDAWTGFEGSPCELYLESIGFVSLKENEIKNNTPELYIDMYGRVYESQPDGFSIINGNKQFKIN